MTAAIDPASLILAPLPAREAAPAHVAQLDSGTFARAPRTDAPRCELDANATWRQLVAVCERAYPREACGWIGDGDGDGDGDGRVRVATAGGRDAFAFSDDDLLALVAAMRSTTPPRALFHSHPDGDAVMSAADRTSLALHPLPHVVVAVAGGRAHAATIYAWRDGGHVPVRHWSRPSSEPGGAR